VSLKIVSWNVNGIRACLKKGLIDFLKDEKPDIVLIQEIKSFPEAVLELWPDLGGYSVVWNPAERPGYSGVASFLRDPVPSQLGMQVEKFDREGRVIVSDFGDFYLINSYFPNGAASDERHFFKMEYLQKFASWMKELEKQKPVILAGDINIAHQALDIHDPVRLDGTSGFKPEEREWMDQFFASGFIDAYRVLYPDAKGQYSWWSYRAGARQRNKGWRIDYFILSEKLDRNIKQVRMEKDILGSDHCPVILELQL